jgi:hypothetical protein
VGDEHTWQEQKLAEDYQLPTGDAWGDRILPDREDELRVLAVKQWELAIKQQELAVKQWELAERLQKLANGEQMRGASLPDSQGDFDQSVFRGRKLTGAEVFWLANYARRVDLPRLDLREAQLQGANLCGARLQGADLRGVSFDKTSRLNDAILTGASLDQVIFDNTNLTVVDWGLVDQLGDERTARTAIGSAGGRKHRRRRLGEYKAAVRANRVLALTLRAQGLNEDADRFAYRAQLMQRVVLRRQRHYLRYLGSLLLGLISGYGYRPLRSFATYLLVVFAFAGAYLLNAQFAAPHISWDEALVLSISAFHGRGFFTTGISLGDTLARLAAGEAIIGLLIEITFIATFTNRFFAR